MNQPVPSVGLTHAESEIGTVLAVFRESWNRHDMAAFAALFTENADFINVFGQRVRGRSAIEAQHVAIHKTVFRNSKVETLDQTVRFLTPEAAVAHVSWRMTGHDTGPVTEARFGAVRNGVFTAVLVPEGGTWRIAALHNTDTVPVPGLGK